MKHIYSLIFISFLLFSVSALDFSASKAAFISTKDNQQITPNENGVYPVHLTWTKDGNSQKLFIFDDSEQDFILLSDSADQEYIHNSSALPCQKLLYKLCTYNASGKLLSEDTDYGWGALTPETYLTTYTTMLDKTQKRLTLMNKKGVLEKLGAESIDGLVSGTLAYKTKIVGFSGLVTMTYTDYQDFDDWYFSGVISTKANMAANGTIGGTMKVTGMYPGQIIYDNAKLKAGIPGGGFYLVTPEGFESAKVDYKYYVVVDPQ